MSHTEPPGRWVLYDPSIHLQLLNHHVYLFLTELFVILLLQQIRYGWKSMWVTIIMRKQVHLYVFP